MNIHHMNRVIRIHQEMKVLERTDRREEDAVINHEAEKVRVRMLHAYHAWRDALRRRLQVPIAVRFADGERGVLVSGPVSDQVLDDGQCEVLLFVGDRAFENLYLALAGREREVDWSTAVALHFLKKKELPPEYEAWRKKWMTSLAKKLGIRAGKVPGYPVLLTATRESSGEWSWQESWLEESALALRMDEALQYFSWLSFQSLALTLPLLDPKTVCEKHRVLLVRQREPFDPEHLFYDDLQKEIWGVPLPRFVTGSDAERAEERTDPESGENPFLEILGRTGLVRSGAGEEILRAAREKAVGRGKARRLRPEPVEVPDDPYQVREITPEDRRSFVIRVSLRKDLYRDIQISSAALLSHLSGVILTAFQFQDWMHLYVFCLVPTSRDWDIPDESIYCAAADTSGPMSEDWPPAAETVTLEEAGIVPHYRFQYIFDLGDCWTFDCEVLREMEEVTEVPILVGRKGEDPEQYPDPEEMDWPEDWPEE